MLHTFQYGSLGAVEIFTPTLLDYWATHEFKVFVHHWNQKKPECEAAWQAVKQQLVVTWPDSSRLSSKTQSLQVRPHEVLSSPPNLHMKVSFLWLCRSLSLKITPDDITVMSWLNQPGPADDKFPVYKLKVWTSIDFSGREGQVKTCYRLLKGKFGIQRFWTWCILET